MSKFSVCILFPVVALLLVLLINANENNNGALAQSSLSNPICANCTELCAPGSAALDTDSTFRVLVTSRYFSRYAFRGAVASAIGLSRFQVMDRNITNETYSFGFTPTGAAKTTGEKVCAISKFLLLSVHACCLHNVTKAAFVASSGQSAEDIRNAHRVKLIVAWVVIGLLGVWTVVLQRRDAKQKDYAIESAKDLAQQKDEDEI